MFNKIRRSVQGGLKHHLTKRACWLISCSNMTIEWKITDEQVPYPDALAFMEARVTDIIENGAPDLIWLLEHPPLYTAGTSADIKDLVDPDRFPVFDAGRGGQYTYHGPGQRVAYVMMDLARAAKREGKSGPDLRAFVNNLEQWIIDTLAEFNVTGERREGRVGVWVDRSQALGPGREDKIAAIGVRVRKWVTWHGISINVEPTLDHFTGIVPCGISEHGVTSLVDLGLPVTMTDLDVALQTVFPRIFPQGDRGHDAA